MEQKEEEEEEKPIRSGGVGAPTPMAFAIPTAMFYNANCTKKMPM